MSAGSAGTEVDTEQRQSSSTASPPSVRKDTMSSTTTNGTTATTATSIDTSEPLYTTAESVSPTYSPQAIFAAREAADMPFARRPSRRRTGPLSATQREKAALIRKLGACNDCRRRRVACHPNHHNMTWEDAVRKYKNHIPPQDYVPLAGRPSNPAVPMSFQSPPREMDVDTASVPTSPFRTHRQHHHQQTHENQILSPSLPPPSSGRLSISSESRLRTPLPSGRNLERVASAALPGIESLTGDLQGATARVINSANPYRSRYDAVHVQMLVWSDEKQEVRSTIDDLAAVFENEYHYSVEVLCIPVTALSPYRWLLQAVAAFVSNHDARETLKILYYAGCSYLDAEREMVLSSSTDRAVKPTIRWSGIQQVLEDAVSDTLILMDAAYYPCSKLTRRDGVLELIAASAGESQSNTLGRLSFTRMLIDELQTRLSQTYRGPLSALSAAELHVRLLSNYPRILQGQSPEQEQMTSFPSPLHLQIAANSRLPSILLAPSRFRGERMSSPEQPSPCTQLQLMVRVSGSGVDTAGWTEWMRLLPEGVQEVKCESPFRSTFR